MKWTQKELEALYQQAIEKASKDKEFFEKMKKDLNAALEELAGRPLPEGFSLNFIERDANFVRNMVTPDFAPDELNMKELQDVQGGISFLAIFSACLLAISIAGCGADACGAAGCPSDNCAGHACGSYGCGGKGGCAGEACGADGCGGYGGCAGDADAVDACGTRGGCAGDVDAVDVCGVDGGCVGETCAADVCGLLGGCVGNVCAADNCGVFGECAAAVCASDNCGGYGVCAVALCAADNCAGYGECVGAVCGADICGGYLDCVGAVCGADTCGGFGTCGGAACGVDTCGGYGECLAATCGVDTCGAYGYCEVAVCPIDNCGAYGDCGTYLDNEALFGDDDAQTPVSTVLVTGSAGTVVVTSPGSAGGVVAVSGASPYSGDVVAVAGPGAPVNVWDIVNNSTETETEALGEIEAPADIADNQGIDAPDTCAADAFSAGDQACWAYSCGVYDVHPACMLDLDDYVDVTEEGMSCQGFGSDGTGTFVDIPDDIPDGEAFAPDAGTPDNAAIPMVDDFDPADIPEAPATGDIPAAPVVEAEPAPVDAPAAPAEL